jgi:hypothetical protein
MLEGTDLSAAYGLVSSVSGPSMFDDEPPMQQPQKRAQPQQYQPQLPAQKSTPMKSLPDNNPVMQQVAQIQAIQQRQHAAPQQQQAQQVQVQQQQHLAAAVGTPQYDQNSFHRQFEQEQQQRMMLQDWNNRRAPQQQMYYANLPSEPSYWDKMVSKKKEVMRFLQSAMIILLAISIHTVIDFVLKHYLQQYDLSYEKELLIRVLYPVGVLLIAWNIITVLR